MDESRRFALVLATTAALCLALMAWLNPQVLPQPLRDAVGLGDGRLGETPPLGSSTSYAFIATQRDGRTPVAYSPCKELEVEINPDGAPSVGEELIFEAMDRIEETTGLQLTYAGHTDRVPRWGESRTPLMINRTQPALVSWATEDEVPQLAGDIAGIGGSVWPSEAVGAKKFLTGQITLDIDAFDRILGAPDGRRLARAVVLHEFGHLVGLDHVDDRTQLMFTHGTRLTDFGRGDLSGLALLGRGKC